jgi:hypothetical protein
MSISVKNSYANEIAESMIETLGNEEFTRLFKKAAELPDVDTVAPLGDPKPAPVQTKVDPQEELNQKFIRSVVFLLKKTAPTNPGVKIEQFTTEPERRMVRKYIDIAKELYGIDDLSKLNPQTQLPKIKAVYQQRLNQAPKTEVISDTSLFADDQMVQDSKDPEECHENHEDNQECDSVDKSGMAVDDNVVAAVDFTISHLTKIASALDNNGFAGLANIIDETIKSVAGKKKINKSAGAQPWSAPNIGNVGPSTSTYNRQTGQTTERQNFESSRGSGVKERTINQDPPPPAPPLPVPKTPLDPPKPEEKKPTGLSPKAVRLVQKKLRDQDGFGYGELEPDGSWGPDTQAKWDFMIEETGANYPIGKRPSESMLMHFVSKNGPLPTSSRIKNDKIIG